MKSILLFLLLLFSQSINACVCDPQEPLERMEQLKEYKFIALVKIEQRKIVEKDFLAWLKVSVVELFSGKLPEQIMEDGVNTSCGMGIGVGETWVLFGSEYNGKLGVYACERSFLYSEANGLRDLQYGQEIETLKTLRSLFNHPIDQVTNGLHREIYPNGQVEIEESFIDGKRQGIRKMWYPNGVLRCDETYVNDSLDGKAVWYYPTGQVEDEGLYIRGRRCNVYRSYYDTTNLKDAQDVFRDFNKKEPPTVCHLPQVRFEVFYDEKGEPIYSRNYSEFGILENEQFTDWTNRVRTNIYYHNNRKISQFWHQRITEDKDFITTGRLTNYSEDGFPIGGWDYDENGKAIKK